VEGLNLLVYDVIYLFLGHVVNTLHVFKRVEVGLLHYHILVNSVAHYHTVMSCSNKESFIEIKFGGRDGTNLGVVLLDN
jgi:hypothetical protein